MKSLRLNIKCRLILSLTEYMQHILFDNKTNCIIHWTHDKASGECFQIDKLKKIDSAMAITHYSSDANKKFD